MAADGTFFNRQKSGSQSVQVVHFTSAFYTSRRLKNYLADSTNRIRLKDLVDEILTGVTDALSGDMFQVDDPIHPDTVSIDELEGMVNGYKRVCAILSEIGPVAGYYAEPWSYDVWEYALSYLVTNTPGNGDGIRLGWSAVPSTLLLHSLGIGALRGWKLDLLGRLFKTVVGRDHGQDVPAIQFLHRGLWFVGMFPISKGKSPFVFGEWLRDYLRPHTRELIPNPDVCDFYFDKLEVLMALSHWYHSPKPRHEVLGFSGHPRNADQILQEIEDSVSKLGDSSPFALSGIAGSQHEDWERGVRLLKENSPTRLLSNLEPFQEGGSRP